MDETYSGGKRIHGFLGNIAATDTAFSWFDDDGNAYTLLNGDRVVVDEMVVTVGASSTSFTIYFDYAGSSTYAANTGEELYLGTPAVGQVVVYPHGRPRAGKRKMAGTVALRAIMGGSSAGSSILVNARVIQS